jgi:hypothetical protein
VIAFGKGQYSVNINFSWDMMIRIEYLIIIYQLSLEEPLLRNMFAAASAIKKEDIGYQ